MHTLSCAQGSSLILTDVFRKRKSRGTVYHQLVVGMSFFDCVSSLAYALVGVMAPKDDGFYLSKGNDATCKVQAFMIQLGLTSVFYNLFLAVYFYLVIRRNWKERQFQRYINYLHGSLIIVGIIMAATALPYYGAQFGTCYLVSIRNLTQKKKETPACVVSVAEMSSIILALFFSHLGCLALSFVLSPETHNNNNYNNNRHHLYFGI